MISYKTLRPKLFNVKTQRVRWMGHVLRVNKERFMREVQDTTVIRNKR